MRRPSKAVTIGVWLFAVAPLVLLLAVFITPCEGWGCWALGMFFYWAVVAACVSSVLLLIVAGVLYFRGVRALPILAAVPVAAIPLAWLLMRDLFS